VAIDLLRNNEAGEADFKWEVTYNSKYGQPGPLAYKIDTLVINRILDQMGRPLPEFVRIGSLSEVCRLLGTQDTGPNITNLRSAFLQNASAFINAKLRYRTKNGREMWTETGYTRYSVVFTGEALPDGSQADAVYIVLNPPYRELLNHVETRPLDYDYLKKLSPGPQRLYELLSFQVYGAIAGNRPRAKMLYSEYCKYAPQVRYWDFDHVKKQMFKLHGPHRDSGYIVKIDYQETTDQHGNPDWEMFYTPGPKAFVEYQTFTNRQLPSPPVIKAPKKAGQGIPVQATLGLTSCDPALLAQLMQRGIAEMKARDLLANIKPSQEVMDQLEYVDSLVRKDRRSKIENPPGLYVIYLRDNITPPADFCSSRKSLLQEQANQAQQAEASRKARLELQYEIYRDQEIKRYATQIMPREEYQQIFDQQRRRNRAVFKFMTEAQMDHLTRSTVCSELEKSGRVKLLAFEEFCRTAAETVELKQVDQRQATDQ